MGICNCSQGEVIIGCSSSNGANSAVSVIRISGSFSLVKFQMLFSKSLANISPRRMYLTRILEQGNALDELLFCFFAAPSSYTGEDILELYPHGNVLNVQRIIDAFVRNFGLRLAFPGEFTFRAFNNKKLNFSQVEGLELLLNANSQFAFNQGLQILNGDLFRSYRQLYDEFLSMKSAINLLIDFSEDVGEGEGRKMLADSLANFGKTISELYKRVQIQAATALFPRIIIFGPTNAGKSSFFNFILAQGRSIVSPIAGTTRDFVSEHIEIGGNLYILTDCAGIRETAESIVEEEGIRRSQALLSDSFLKVLVLSSSNIDAFTSAYSDFDLLLITHSDLYFCSDVELRTLSSKFACPILLVGRSKNSAGSIGPQQIKSGSIGPEQIDYTCFHSIKANLGSIGPEESDLLNYFKEIVVRKYTSVTSKNPILVERHRHVISEIYNGFSELGQLADLEDLGLVSNKINNIGVVVNELIGIVTADDSLDLIFSKFCIGK
ncbi:MAG: hypothetical protein A2X86_05040 [Bdellovibrionales bacterium GWA2_49_15]|nr:MAG: hypothetical protein A2X86_05040 [Bdellovibrionales bacterium GWA2_49_15]